MRSDKTELLSDLLFLVFLKSRAVFKAHVLVLEICPEDIDLIAHRRPPEILRVNR